MKYRKIIKKLEIKTQEKTHIPENPMHESLKKLITAVQNKNIVAAEDAEDAVFKLLRAVKVK